MYISRRTSGGRGEYEVSHPAEGEVHPRELIGRFICVDLGLGPPINTHVVLREQGGKLRLRRFGGGMQVQRQVAAALMLPEPVRADAPLGSGAPVIQRNRYAIERLEADQVLLIPPDLAVMRIGRLILTNRTYLAEELPLHQRAAQLASIWTGRDEFPAAIAVLLQQHAAAVATGGAIGQATEALVREIQRAVSESSADLGLIYSEAGDVLPALAEALRLEVPAPLVEIADVDFEDLPMRKRTLKEWRRWASLRGPASARFRQRVRDAYRATCVVCAARFPRTPVNTGPGVDAAHILPWSQYDLDDVANGLCLCKIHHWAFDESLIRLRFKEKTYLVEVPEQTRQAIVQFDPGFSIERLTEHAGVVPTCRLPRDTAEWPRPQFLLALEEYAD